MFERRRYSWEYQLKIEYDKLKEKADKWDNMMEKSMEAPYIDCVGNAKKLEAVTEWFTENGPFHCDVHDLIGLRKILEAEE